MFMNFGDMNEAADSLHDVSQTLIPLTVLGGNLPVLLNHLPVLGDKQLDALRERLMAFRQPFDSFVDRHVL